MKDFMTEHYKLMDVFNCNLKGMKLVEIPWLEIQLQEQTEQSDILIIGERAANDGITQAVLKNPFNSITATDIMSSPENSHLSKLTKNVECIEFVQADFVSYDYGKKFDYIVCINVLEHFGMNFSEQSMFDGELAEDDYIRWNHDLRALNKMMSLLKDGSESKIIVTVPAGQPILSGDIDINNDMPFIRRYDTRRIKIIERLVNEFGKNINNEFFFSKDFVEWFEADESVTHPNALSYNNPHSPNICWAFTITN